MKTLNVIETETGEIVSRIDVSTKNDRQIDKCEMGLLRNMDLDRFHVERATTGNATADDGKDK